MNSQDNDGMQIDVKVFYTLESAIYIYDCHYVPKNFVERQLWASHMGFTEACIKSGQQERQWGWEDWAGRGRPGQR